MVCLTILRVDITGGGGTDEEALWYMNEQEVLKNLDRIFETSFLQPGRLSSRKSVCKPISEDSLIEFQQFQRKTQIDRPSTFTCMLQRHGRNMTYVLDWVICQLVQLCKAKPMFDSERSCKEW